MKTILRLLLNAVAVVILAKVLNGVYVDSYLTAFVVAVVIAVLNLFIKPLLVVFTFPITIITLGLFLLFINAFIILLADKLIDGFSVNSIWIALVFSLLLSFLQSVFQKILKEDEKRS